jgi:hypothetical protein
MSIPSRRRAPAAFALACALALPMLAAGPAQAQVTSQLKVFKYINGDVRPAGVPFSITVTCANPAFSQSATVLSESFAEFSTIPVPNTCTVTENLPLPPPPAGYAWNPANTPPQPQVVQVPDASEIVVSVFNALIPVAGTTGELRIGKTVTGGSAPGAQFTVQVSCSSPAFNASVQVPAGGNVVVGAIPAPNTCTVSESATLPPPPPGFVWNPANTPPPPVAVAVAVGATATVGLVNDLLGIPTPPPPARGVPLATPVALALLGVLMLLAAALRMPSARKR